MATYRDLDTGEILTQDQFDQLPETDSLSQIPQTRRVSFLERSGNVLGKVFGGEKIGEAIGAGVARLGLTGLTPEQRKNVSFPSAGEVAGDVAQIGLTLGTLGGAGTAGRLGARVLKTATLGAGFEAAAAAKKGEKVTPGAIATGAAVGAGIPLAGAGLKVAGNLLTENAPRWLISTLHPTKDITQHILENTKIGTTKSLINNAQSDIRNLHSQRRNILTSNKYKNTFISKKNLLSSAARSFGQTGGGGTLSTEEIQKIVLKTAPQAKGLLSKVTLSIADADKLREIVDGILGAKFFLKTQAPFNKEVLGNFNNFLRSWVKDTAKETVPLFDEESKNITLRNALQVAQKRFARIGLYEIVSALGGGSVGGITGATGAVAAEKFLRSPATAIGAAKILSRSARLAPILQKTGIPFRTGILRNLNSSRDQSTLEEQVR